MDHPPPSESLLHDRVILVTGAGTGLGRAAAMAFAAQGATVVLVGPAEHHLETVYDAIEAAGHPQPALFVMDLRKAEEKDFQSLATGLDQEFGRLDGLLHNAAVLPYLGRIDDYDAKDWRQVLQVNLTAPFLLTQACLPLLRRSQDASVVFTSDAAGRQGKAYWGAYGVSKFGIEGLMQTLAEELRDSSPIRVNSIDPGPVRTDMRVRVFPGTNPAEWPLPETVMGTYLYLMGPESKGVTGRAFSAQAQAAGS